MSSIEKEIENESGRCIKCGFCNSVCPTLSAKDFSEYYGARGRMILANELIKKKNDDFFNFLKLSQKSFESCLSCYACLMECPAALNAGHVSELVRQLIVTLPRNKVAPNPISALITKPITKYGNPLGLRGKDYAWTKGISLPDKGDFLLFTGSLYQLMPYSSKLVKITSKLGEDSTRKLATLGSRFSSVIKISRLLYDPTINTRMQKIMKDIVKLLQISGVSFYYDADLEVYPGTYLYELGFEESFKEYAKKVSENFRKKGVKKIITIDPHTYDLLKNVYPKYTNFEYEVVYYLDLVQIDFNKTEMSATYHDPCHLSRHSNYFAKPRELISLIAKIREPTHYGSKTMCCGGPDELEFPGIASKISERRYSELKNTKADVILTSCPVCYVNLAKDESVMDIAEFLLENVSRKPIK